MIVVDTNGIKARYEIGNDGWKNLTIFSKRCCRTDWELMKYLLKCSRMIQAKLSFGIWFESEKPKEIHFGAYLWGKNI